MTTQFQTKKIAITIISSLFLAGCIPVEINPPTQIELPTETQTNTNNKLPSSTPPKEDIMTEPIIATQATINTSKGKITIKFFNEEAPNTVQNFLNKSKKEFYNALTFHRVEDWVIQGGDPLGNGTGGGQMPSEINNLPFTEGSVGIARGGDIKVNNDSQFFICTKDCDWLNGQYTLFAQVTEGMDVVKQIEIGDTIVDITFQ